MKKTVIILKAWMIGLLAAGILSCFHGSAQAIRYFAQQPGMPASTTPYGANDAAGHRAQTENGVIYYEVYGKGSPLVVLHGDGLGCTFEMGAFIDRLRSNHTVIAVSTRGHGRSDIGHKPFSLEQRADDIHTAELAQVASINLFQYMNDAADKALQWIAADDTMHQLCGLCTAYHLLRRDCLDERRQQEVADQAQSLTSSTDLSVRRVANNILNTAGVS